MNKTTLKSIILLLCVFNLFVVDAQNRRQEITKDKKTTVIDLTEANRQSQQNSGFVKCLTSEYNNDLVRRNSSRMTNQQFEDWLAPKIEEIKAERAAGRNPFPSVVTIPVVVHVIHNGDAIGVNENIADGQVLSQIQVFNEDFRKMTGTPGDGAGVDTMIEFCMAQVDPSGNATSGIDRVNLGQASWNQAGVEGTLKPNTIWDPTKYLNMWTCNFGGDLNGVLGYAQFPSGSGLAGMPAEDCVTGEASTDGVIAAYDTFGSRNIYPTGNYGSTQYDEGRTMTHEVGHMLGLRHIWGDTGNCSNDDFCADTPDATAANFGCVTQDSCPADGLGNDQSENYMDYSDDSCMNMFTQDQADRLMAVLLNSPRRDDLLVSNVCNALQPNIQFKRQECELRAPRSLNEASNCSYTELTIPLSIDTAPSANAIVTFAVDGTSTVSASEVEFVTPTVTFTSGSNADQDMVVRILNDKFVEGDEELVISFTVNANGGNALANTEGNTFVIDVLDDDVAITPVANVTLFSENFDPQTNSISIVDEDGDGENWSISNEASFGSTIGFSGNFALSRSWNGSVLTPDNLLLNGDVISIPAGMTNVELSFVAGTIEPAPYDAEYYSVYVTTSNVTATIIASTAVYSETLNYPTAGFSTRTVNLDAYAGQDVYVTFRHHNCTDMNTLIIDDILVTGDMVTTIQTAVNTGVSNDQMNLNGMGTAYATDSSTGDLMLSVTNNDTFDYGCTDVSVSRAGVSAQPYNGSVAPNLATDKTFTITPTNTNAGGDNTVVFYFTEAEIAGWETATGDSRNNLYILQDNGVDQTFVPASLGTFGTDVSLSATFTSGLDGTYYFASLTTLGVDTFNAFDVFNVYPNPSNGQLNITLSTNEDVKISLYDVRGRLYYNNKFTNNSSVFNEALSFSNVSSGIYLLQIESGTKKAVKKLVIK